MAYDRKSYETLANNESFETVQAVHDHIATLTTLCSDRAAEIERLKTLRNEQWSENQALRTRVEELEGELKDVWWVRQPMYAEVCRERDELRTEAERLNKAALFHRDEAVELRTQLKQDQQCLSTLQMKYSLEAQENKELRTRLASYENQEIILTKPGNRLGLKTMDDYLRGAEVAMKKQFNDQIELREKRTREVEAENKGLKTRLASYEKLTTQWDVTPPERMYEKADRFFYDCTEGRIQLADAKSMDVLLARLAASERSEQVEPTIVKQTWLVGSGYTPMVGVYDTRPSVENLPRALVTRLDHYSDGKVVAVLEPIEQGEK